MNPKDTRDRLHHLVDRLSAGDLPTAVRVLEALQAGDPVRRALEDAPEEERSLSAKERAALEEAEEDARRGDLRSLEDYLAEREA